MLHLCLTSLKNPLVNTSKKTYPNLITNCVFPAFPSSHTTKFKGKPLIVLCLCLTQIDGTNPAAAEGLCKQSKYL